jgi:radical SAM protein with 4Fe4S-binding SPASM domain
MMTSLNSFSTVGIQIDKTTTPNSRARLFTGKLCNYRCEFCYYKNNLSDRDSLDLIFSRIDDIKRYGIEEIDLSGGESSVEPNWFKILERCQLVGFKNISCLSHGGKFSNPEFVTKSAKLGLSEVLFSLHGATAEIHDRITERKGSFDNLLTAIKNCQAQGLKIRINCTVYDINYLSLAGEYADLIKSIKPWQVNFIALNYGVDNHDFRFNNYQLITTEIKRCIDNIKDTVEHINVRYTPFCYMQGYEQYVVNYYQHIYDLHDWNLAMFDHDLDTSIEYTQEEKLQHSYNKAKERRIHSFAKQEECRNCKNFFICDGVDKEIADSTPVMPIAGDKITTVNFYRSK